MSSNRNLRVVKDQADHIYAHQGADLNFKQCSNLILSASVKYDTQLIPSSSKVFQKAHSSDIGNHNFYRDTPLVVTKD